MQNEELRRTQVELEAAWVRYFDLYDLAPVGYFTFSEQGLILQANLTAATLLGLSRAALVKEPVSRFVFREDQDTFYRHRKKLFETAAPQSYELWHALKTLGVPTQLVVFPGEGHAIHQPQNRRELMRRMLGWFDRYLQVR